MFSATTRRFFGGMASSTTSAPYTRAVVNSMRKLYPEELADKSFDNTGLLLEAPFDPTRRQKHSALLTIDLTKAVADEAIARKDSIVVSYHPIIFRGLKSITFADSQQQSLLRLAAHGISVYSPHTAVDSQAGGLGDWLADIITGTPTADSNSTPSAPSSQPSNLQRPTYQLKHHPSQLSLHSNTLSLGQSPHTRKPITPSGLPSHPSTGMGRVVRFNTPVPLPSIIDRIGLGLGNPKAIPLAVPQTSTPLSDIKIRSVGICAGSGGSLFAKLDEDVDLLFTGEMSHHEALAAIEKGQCVVTLGHSNTERGFLHAVLRGQLETTIAEEWEKIRKEEKGKKGLGKEHLEALNEGHIEVHVSEVDRDPFGMMIAKTDE